MLCCGGRARRRRCARVAAILLTHVNLLLMLFSGAALATVARLKWDPSAYIPLREALPLEYRAACALLLLFALALLALAHAAAAALASSGARRPLLFTYAALMSALTLVEVGAIAWVVSRALAFLDSPAAARLLEMAELRAHVQAALAILARWYPLPDKINALITVGAIAWVVSRALAFLDSPAAARLLEMAELRAHVQAALAILARWYPLPDKINALITEALDDAPRNGYVAEGAAIALLILQPTAVALALLAAGPRAAPRRLSLSTLATTASAGAYSRGEQRARYNYYSDADKSNALEKAPLRTAYRNGRLVIL